MHAHGDEERTLFHPVHGAGCGRRHPVGSRSGNDPPTRSARHAVAFMNIDTALARAVGECVATRDAAMTCAAFEQRANASATIVSAPEFEVHVLRDVGRGCLVWSVQNQGWFCPQPPMDGFTGGPDQAPPPDIP